MLPPVITATSPSSNARVMVPPVIRKVSRPSPWASEPSVPPLMKKSSGSSPWFRPPLISPADNVNESIPALWVTLPRIRPDCISTLSIPDP